MSTANSYNTNLMSTLNSVCSNDSTSNPNPVCIKRPPLICNPDVVPTDVDGCDMWNTAIGEMHAKMTNAKKDTNTDEFISGNYNKEIATCYRIPKNQVYKYGDDNIFDIEALQNGWTNSTGSTPAAGNINCQRTIYGIFDSAGSKIRSDKTNINIGGIVARRWEEETSASSVGSECLSNITS